MSSDTDNERQCVHLDGEVQELTQNKFEPYMVTAALIMDNKSAKL